MPINSVYQQEDTVKRIKQELKKQKQMPSVQLFEFFTPDVYHQLKRKLTQLTYKRSTELFHHRYATKKLPAKFFSEEIIEAIQRLVNTEKQIKFTAYCFSWKDYQVLHDKKVEKPGTDIIFDFSDKWQDDYGGHIVYVDGRGNYITTPVQGNTVSIVKRSSSIQKFVQYVNNHGKDKKRLFVIATFS